MERNNLKVKILLVLVLIIWGAIGYKIYNTIHDSDTSSIVMEPKSTIQEIGIIKSKNKFYDYKDPFLKDNNSSSSLNLKYFYRKKELNQSTHWPIIRYKGYFQNDQLSTFVNILIEDQEYILKIGESVNDIKLIEINDSTILLSNNQQIKRIKLSE